MTGVFRKKAKRIAVRHEEAAVRVGKMSTPYLYEWAESCMYVYGKSMREAQEAGDTESTAQWLEEAQLGALVAHEIAIELKSRQRYDMIPPHADRPDIRT